CCRGWRRRCWAAVRYPVVHPRRVGLVRSCCCSLTRALRAVVMTCSARGEADLVDDSVGSIRARSRAALELAQPDRSPLASAAPAQVHVLAWAVLANRDDA